MDIDEILMTTEEAMDKAFEYLKSEMKGVRTGRASTGLVEFIKIEYFGSMTDLRSIAMINTPEPAQILVKPFDPSSLQAIIKGIQNAGLGLNPMAEGKACRINVPALSGERRNQLIGSVKESGEKAKVSIRNARRDGNKLVDAAEKDKTLHLSEDDISAAKEEIQTLVKKYEVDVDKLIVAKTAEINEI
jgi:ribosome recycling factor